MSHLGLVGYGLPDSELPGVGHLHLVAKEAPRIPEEQDKPPRTREGRDAYLDPLSGYEDEGGEVARARDLLERLRELGPEGKDNAWLLLIDGLLGLLTEY